MKWEQWDGGEEGGEEVSQKFKESNAISFRTDRAGEMETAHTAINIPILQWFYCPPSLASIYQPHHISCEADMQCQVWYMV